MRNFGVETHINGSAISKYRFGCHLRGIAVMLVTLIAGFSARLIVIPW
jgi:hypothetical protein